MIYVKGKYPRSVYETAYTTLWMQVYVSHVDLSVPTNMARALATHFSEREVAEILEAASTPEIKGALSEATQKCVAEYGAFGCPWFWIRNSGGKEEPFFGSDRWAFMWDFLDIPHRQLAVVGDDEESEGSGGRDGDQEERRTTSRAGSRL